MSSSCFTHEVLTADQSTYYAKLKEAYRTVGERTWLERDFAVPALEVSRDLFTPESLLACKPRPKALEVYALLSGLPFARGFTDKLVAVQTRISKILRGRLHYWVAPQNLGVEYCVFKWPADPWDDSRLDIIQNALAAIRPKTFRFHIRGVQVNPDGCVVARGFDQNAQLFRVRAQLKADVPALPEKQSQWAHVPLGRILEPLGTERFTQLAHLMSDMSDMPITSTEVDTMKLVHETRWYMEERTTLAEYPLDDAADGEMR